MTEDAVHVSLLPGARALLRRHAAELPQRDDLCGAFCGALALAAAGLERRGGSRDGAGEPLDQDAVAVEAGSVVSRTPDPQALPHGERGRRDYRIEPPLIEDGSRSGTTAEGVVRAVEELGEGLVDAIPYTGPWSESSLAGLYELAASRERPATLIANVATKHLWGSSPSVEQLLSYLLEGVDDGPPPDWDVGHFVCLVGRLRGPRGARAPAAYVVADTYPSLGRGGVHVQPGPRLVPALDREGMAPGGMIAVVAHEEAEALRDGAQRLGLREGVWDNGTVTAETAS